MSRTLILFCALLAGCAAAVPSAQAPAGECRAELARVVRAAARREEALRKQLEALKSIERDILEREDGLRSQVR